MRMSRGTLDAIRELSSEGVAPSEIDARIGLEKGTAHDVIVKGWELSGDEDMVLAWFNGSLGDMCPL